jgi:hypothetical protein
MSGTHRRAFLFIISLGLLATAATAQEQYLKGRSRFELSMGLWFQAQASSVIQTGGVVQTAESNGFLGALSYSRWTTEQLAWSISAGLLSAKASMTIGPSGIDQSASAIIPILVGAKYHLSAGDLSSPRFFLAGSAGPVLGTEAKNSLTGQSATTSTAFGFKPGVGVDLFLSSTFAIAVEGGYFLTTTFKEPIGGRTSFPGPFFTISLGVMFGSVDGAKQ